MTTRTAPYGAWPSPIDLRALFERPSVPACPAYYRGQVYWLEARAAEGGRLVLMRRDADGRDVAVTPGGFNIRTQVHEYGGRCFAFGNDTVYFSNFSDQRIYAQPLVGASVPRPVTPEADRAGRRLMYADFQLTPCGQYLVCVCETEGDNGEHVNCLAVVALSGAVDRPSEPRDLVSGSDFYANPVLAPNGKRIAWIQWNHPHMPWEETQAWTARVTMDGELSIVEPVPVPVPPTSAVCQLCYLDDDTLLLAVDRDAEPSEPANFWNIHTFRAGVVEAVTADLAEYGYPHWVFGNARYTPVGGRTLLAIRTVAGGDELVEVDVGTKTITPVATDYNSFAQCVPAEPGGEAGGALLIAGSGTRAPALVRYRGGTTGLQTVVEPMTLLEDSNISRAEPIRYPTRDGMQANAYFYPPCNAAFSAPAGTRPPLLVTVHGGPTSRAHPLLDTARQYWTTCGYAVLDVNHRGSTGFGRRYRQSLQGHWGEYDAIDIVDGIEYLKSRDRIDPARVCIRGRSAGGYAVLRVLTYFPEYFHAGACYFGIGNLATLAESTHKFERYYTDTLVGERYDPVRSRDPESAYYQRSPIHFIDRVRSPVILFQGTEDRVVPPDVSREMVRVLEERGVPHEYVEYPGEGHGFRGAETSIDALTRETAFFADALRIGTT